MLTATQAAKWFLRAGANAGEPLTALKLQALLYYAQGHHLGRTGDTLFPETIYAWGRGPIVQEVLEAFDRSCIDPNSRRKHLGFDTDPDEESTLNRVWKSYGMYSTWYLRDLVRSQPPYAYNYRAGKHCQIPTWSLCDFFAPQYQYPFMSKYLVSD